MYPKDVSKAVISHKDGAELPALMNFAAIRRENDVIWPITPGKISIEAGLFKTLFRLALEHIQIDEKYYLRLYPDVEEAIREGLFENPRHHYIEFGYFENRQPFRIKVDEEFYFRENSDIKVGVDRGLIPSAQVHFERYGYKEGRLPREGWSLLAG